MREDVFHTPEAVTLAVQRLTAQGVNAEKIEELKVSAEKASTPEQVAVLEKRAR